jgi:hypothetical protein
VDLLKMRFTAEVTACQRDSSATSGYQVNGAVGST